MSRDYELDLLRSEEQATFQRKQVTWASFADAKERASMAHETMDVTWNERCRAREEMNREFESMRASSEHYREVWDEYGHIRDYNNSRIESLRYEVDAEHQAMIDCFERANAEYEYGDKSVAPMYASEGHDHRDPGTFDMNEGSTFTTTMLVLPLQTHSKMPHYTSLEDILMIIPHDTMTTEE